MPPSAAPTPRLTALADHTPRPAIPAPTGVLAALRETGELVGAALGDQRRRELRTQGAAMSMDEAISYLLANIDPKLLTGPIILG